MKKTTIQKVGECPNCGENNIPLEVVEIDGEEQILCDACADGYRLEQEEGEL